MIRAIGRFPEHPRLVAAAQTPLGRLVLGLAALYLLRWNTGRPALLAGVAAVLVFPQWRRPLLSLAAVWGLVLSIRGDLSPQMGLSAGLQAWLPVLLPVLLLLGLCFAFFQAAKQFARLPDYHRRHPHDLLHALVWIAIMAVWLLPDLRELRALVAILPLLVWRLGYMLKSGARGTAVGTRFRDHLFYLFPTWGSVVPYGKGFDFLSRRECRSAEELASSQLFGLKLLLLATLWLETRQLLDVVVFGVESSQFRWLDWGHHVPTLSQQLGNAWPISVPMAWSVVFLELVRRVLEIARFGHQVIGALALAGFRLPRNTHEPLLAQSIVDYWSRFFFYFKELLVDFFFYPVYLRCFKKRPVLRMFTAVFAAAFLGNTYFHVLYDDMLLRADFRALAWGHAPRAVYCFALAVGVAVSMLRQPKLRAAGVQAGPLTRWRRRAGVWLFYGLIYIWNVDAQAGISDRLAFCASLLGR